VRLEERALGFLGVGEVLPDRRLAPRRMMVG